MRRKKKVKEGDQRPLKPYRWWNLLTRTLFYLRLSQPSQEDVTYAVDVRYMAEEPTAYLYRNGYQQSYAKMPATFEVEGGTIEVAASSYGLKRMHYVTPGGDAQTLHPHPKTAEGRRARFAKRSPGASRLIGVIAIVVLLISLPLFFLQAAEYLTNIEPIAEHIGSFTSPIVLPLWQNIAITAAGVIAAFERALTLRSHWLIDMETTWVDS